MEIFSTITIYEWANIARDFRPMSGDLYPLTHEEHRLFDVSLGETWRKPPIRFIRKS